MPSVAFFRLTTPAGRLLRQHVRARFCGELILRAKLMIEAAMCQAGVMIVII